MPRGRHRRQRTEAAKYPIKISGANITSTPSTPKEKIPKTVASAIVRKLCSQITGTLPNEKKRKASNPSTKPALMVFN